MYYLKLSLVSSSSLRLLLSTQSLFLETVDAAEDMKLNFMAVAEMFLANSITEQHS